MSPGLPAGLPAGVLEPGRHAAYVWAAYVLSAAALVGATLESWLRARRWRRRVERLEAERAARNGGRPDQPPDQNLGRRAEDQR